MAQLSIFTWLVIWHDGTVHDGPVKTNYWPVVCPLTPSSFSYTVKETLKCYM